MSYRKRPVVIEAVQWSGSNWHEMYAFAGHNVYTADVDGLVVLRVKTLEGETQAPPGHWVIRGVNGEFYPCDPEIFAKTYEEVETPE